MAVDKRLKLIGHIDNALSHKLFITGKCPGNVCQLNLTTWEPSQKPSAPPPRQPSPHQTQSQFQIKMTTKLLFIVVAVDDTTQTENKQKKQKRKYKSWRQTTEKRGELPSAVLIFLFDSHCSALVVYLLKNFCNYSNASSAIGHLSAGHLSV